jgi:cytochrome P450
MESARVHSLAFNIVREPSPTACLKEYYVGDVDVIAMCEVLLHFQGEAARKVFSKPEDYNPERFLELGESCGPTTHMTFGAGSHRCVGKALGLLETKVGLAHVLLNFRNEFNQTKVPKHGYLSPSGLAGSEMQVILTALSENGENDEIVTCPT